MNLPGKWIKEQQEINQKLVKIKEEISVKKEELREKQRKPRKFLEINKTF